MRMSALELDRWKQYAAIEPFGQERDNAHAALITSTIANGLRLFVKDPPEEFAISDFMLFQAKDNDEQPTEVTDDMLTSIGAIFGIAIDA